ncbi:malectin domain-containing carbohydrate-binding protein [Halomicrococcus gelatinilyticus]|uniref:malectin domain-containing carbohydrate-binding protein n=1 Tax=Halomicrococcus gelatinilyticus TaxID=1702103 RepID=UPI002E132DCE
MADDSRDGFTQGALVGGGIVFFVAGTMILTGIPSGGFGSVSGGTHDGTAATTTEAVTTGPESTQDLSMTTSSEPTRTPSATTGTETTTATPTATATPTTAPTRTTEAPQSEVRYRINVGGERLKASDGGPDWLPDTERNPSWFGNARLSGSRTNRTSDQIATTSAVPDGTPEAVFQRQRYDPDVKGDPTDDVEMQYRFPVENGRYVVRLYFAETYFGETGWRDYKKSGPRKFAVEVEDETVLDDYDVYRELGHDRGTTKSFAVESEDGVLDVVFRHKKGDPTVAGIEVVRDDGEESDDGEDDER